MRGPKIGQPLVVDPHGLDGGLRVAEPPGDAEDAVEDLGLNAVAILVAQAGIGMGEAPDAAFAVVVEPGGGHAVRAMDAPGHVLAARRAHAAGQAEVGALLRRPARALRAIDNVRHPVAPLGGGGVGDEQVGRQPAQVDVAVGGDHLVTHPCLLRRTSSSASDDKRRRVSRKVEARWTLSRIQSRIRATSCRQRSPMISPEERAVRVDLAACYRLVARYGWEGLVFTHISSWAAGGRGPLLNHA